MRRLDRRRPGGHIEPGFFAGSPGPDVRGEGDLPVVADELSDGEGLMGSLLPGGYTLIHLIFWPIVVLVAIGTNAVPIMLSVAILLLTLEAVGKS